MQWRHAIDRDPNFDSVDDWSIPNPKPTTPQQVVERALSTSFIAALEPDNQSEVLHDVRQIATTIGDSFDFPYRSELQAWQLISPS